MSHFFVRREAHEGMKAGVETVQYANTSRSGLHEERQAFGHGLINAFLNAHKLLTTGVALKPSE